MTAALIDSQFIELWGMLNQWVLISLIVLVVVLFLIGFLHHSIVGDVNKMHKVYQRQIQELTDRVNKIKPMVDPFKK